MTPLLGIRVHMLHFVEIPPSSKKTPTNPNILDMELAKLWVYSFIVTTGVGWFFFFLLSSFNFFFPSQQALQCVRMLC